MNRPTETGDSERAGTADFSLTGYRGIIDFYIDRGYTAVDFETAEPGARHLILRHDIDMSVQAALTMAEAEAEIGVKASYFVLLRSDLYNPWSKYNQADLSRISELGHEIGLHFDASLYPGEDDRLEAAIDTECAMLERCMGIAVKTVSFHRPASALLGRPGKIAGRRHSYEPRFFHEMTYCSDSRGLWAHGHPTELACVQGGSALQLLTHPVWWVRGDHFDPVVTLDAIRKRNDRCYARALADNCEPYRLAMEQRDDRDQARHPLTTANRPVESETR